ncbi:hypothetical protein [Roseinatronobacter sp. S2]|uniref:hypothetical protein n=1 Tax=Roseinatronobacter sp. S2 TaxID=3035471 RepID=UPI00240F4ED4|nr:hypothetical protein [Roseinatronobacter sp. S2]WFE74661.1 hypothetical protein P8S53_15920 [Roseinatronobacter sp. S2]
MNTSPLDETIKPILRSFDHVLSQLASASSAGKATYQGRMLDTVKRLLKHPGGLAALEARVEALEQAGIFAGTDWAVPSSLVPGMVGNTLKSTELRTVALECVNLLRFLAVVRGVHSQPRLPVEHARHFLTQVLALNLDRILGAHHEAARVSAGELDAAVDQLLKHILDKVGTEGILGQLVDEVWRIMRQRPIQVDHVKSMILQIAIAMNGDGQSFRASDTRLGADRLISALFGPTDLCREDPGLAVYRDRLNAADTGSLQAEATGMARAMHDTGLVSDYHADFLRFVMETGQGHLLADALGLSSTGLDALRCYQALVQQLIDVAVRPGTAQAVLGIALMLERGILYSPPIAPSLWRLLGAKLTPDCEAGLIAAFGTDPTPHQRLVAGVMMLLGQPLGIGQGNNPTCQSARALSMWALNDPDYLLWQLAQATSNDRIIMHFEGQPLDSGTLPAGLALHTPLDADPVSAVLVPHLDRIYAEMGRRVLGRGEDPHRWINPELHGWWVGREFHIAVDVMTGKLHAYDQFIRDFHIAYHPLHNGNEPVIHPQPAGIAVTDSQGTFVGWHAISIIRVALDQSGMMRVYFFNPNNDSGQDWGHGIVVSTHGNGERLGEASLPFAQFTSRLYIFHDDGLETAMAVPVEDAEVAVIREMAHKSWACDRL